MKTFYELGTQPQVGDLIVHLKDSTMFFMITKIVGDTIHTHKKDFCLHIRHVRSNYTPLGQETL